MLGVPSDKSPNGNQSMSHALLLKLVDEHGIGELVDYLRLSEGDKRNFRNKLFKYFDKAEDHTIKLLRDAGGLKLHFKTKNDELLTKDNIPSSTFIKKSAFYSNKTLVTFPFKDIAMRQDLLQLSSKSTSQWPQKWGGAKNEALIIRYPKIPTKSKSIDYDAFNIFVDLIVSNRALIESEVISIIPSFVETDKKLKKRKTGLVSANFQESELSSQFFDPSEGRCQSGLTSLLLPHFHGLSLERVLDIRNKEEFLYMDFQRRLERLVKESSVSDSELAILGFLRDVDEGVRELHSRFESIEREYRRKNIHMLIKFIAVGLTAFSPIDPAAKASVASLLGGISAFDYLSSKEDHDSKIDKLREDRFYLPWLLFKE